MICSRCKINTASFFYTQSLNGSESSVALCKECAEKSGVTSSLVTPLFNSFFKNQKFKTSLSDSTKKCTLCALTFKDILSLGKVGCPECYRTFKEELGDTIRSIHGSAKHVGNTPYGSEAMSEITEEDALRSRLEQAIKEENYEEAAKIRDQIKDLKGEKQ